MVDNYNNQNGRFTTELFSDRDSAEKAYDAAIKKGYKAEDINVLMSEDSRKKYYDSELVKDDTGHNTVAGVAVGSVLGGTVGGILGAVVAMGTNLVIPGLGLIVAGPIAAGLAGVGAGSISGGLIGALVGWGIPEETAKHYENGIKSGGIVLGVDDHLENSQLHDEWKKYKNPSAY